MSRSEDDVGCVGVVAAIIGVIAGCGLGVAVVDKAWKADLVEKGHAEYNSATGLWQWKERKDATSEQEAGQAPGNSDTLEGGDGP